MRIEKAVIRQMKLPFKTGFRTSFGTTVVKDFLLVELYDAEGRLGLGECSAPLVQRRNDGGRALCDPGISPLRTSPGGRD